jgi:hypothetical protein
VIPVAGEALFDLVVTPYGQVEARLDGAGSNEPLPEWTHS